MPLVIHCRAAAACMVYYRIGFITRYKEMHEVFEELLGHGDQVRCIDSQNESTSLWLFQSLSLHNSYALVTVRSSSQVFLVITCVFVIVCLCETLKLPELLCIIDIHLITAQTVGQ